MKKTCLYILIASILLFIVLPSNNIEIQRNNPFVIQTQIDKIKSNKKWYDSIKTKAKKNKIDIEDQVFLDAIFILRKDKLYDKALSKKINEIKMNTKKYTNVLDRAKKTNKTVHFQLYFKAHSEIENNYIQNN